MRDIIDIKKDKKTEQKHVVTLTVEEISALKEKIIKSLKTVFDPEIPVDIYELGLIYKVDLVKNDHVKVTMTLTAPGCPVAGEMPIWVHDAVKNIDEINKVEVELVFDPPWTVEHMSQEARLDLGWL